MNTVEGVSDRRLPLTAAGRAEWADYLAKSRRAHLEYKMHPTAPWRRTFARPCTRCGLRTFCKDSVCTACKATA